MTVSRSKYAFIAPTYKQAKNIAWDILKEYARKVDGVQFNESELRADFRNRSRITLYGSDNPDALRGMGLWGVVYDEYSQQPSNIHTEIILPALADHQGFAIWIGTPKGKNSFYELFEQAKRDPAWLALFLTVADTNLIPEEELDESRKVMTEDEFQQEWYCSFEAAIKGAYYAKELSQARKDDRITNVPYQKDAKVYTWWDLGIADATAIGFFQHIGQEWHLIDYYEQSGEGLEHYVQVLQDKEYIYDGHFAPHDIRVRELGSGKSRLEVARQLGLNFQIVPNLPLMEGINALRRRFNTLWIDEDKCSILINNLALYRKEWDDEKGIFKTKPLHDFTSHSADMMRYWAVGRLETAPKVYTPNWAGYGKLR